MSLTVCKNCSVHIYTTDSVCPHCGSSQKRELQVSNRRHSMAVLLGLALVGCGDKEDTASDTSEPITQPAYGVAEEEPEGEEQGEE